MHTEVCNWPGKADTQTPPLRGTVMPQELLEAPGHPWWLESPPAKRPGPFWWLPTLPLQGGTQVGCSEERCRTIRHIHTLTTGNPVTSEEAP